jgi:hypothetical protein
MFRTSRIKAAIRVTPEPILSKISEPQPEPEPDRFSQFAKIDEGFWAWHFTVRDSRGEEMASISRAFRGFGREMFTDTGKLPTSRESRSEYPIMCRTILGELHSFATIDRGRCTERINCDTRVVATRTSSKFSAS